MGGSKGSRRWVSRRLLVFLTVVLAGLLALEASLASSESVASSTPDHGDAPPDGWMEVGYGAIVDPQAISRSGEPLGSLLSKLGGRPMPRADERPDDARLHRIIEPLLESYAFVLVDALDSMAPAPDPPRIELGGLWQSGEAQPAWADLLRSRRYLVESDGRGSLRAILPWEPPIDGSEPSPANDAEVAAREAWEQARPVLRHVLLAERRRLAQRPTSPTNGPELELQVHAYRHDPARTRFRLTEKPFRVSSPDILAGGSGLPVDLAALRSVFEKPQRLEGARLLPNGALRFLVSEAPAPPSILGRPLGLSDVAVAYRAVFHGGLNEPFMSLDRGPSPQTALVNYGGRLKDTALGWVSLLADVRFKTFSLGIDPFQEVDARPRIRRDVPSFRTHYERFAADARSAAVTSQQTRLWFYPDNVDLLVSAGGDLLAMRNLRLTAASERLADTNWGSDRSPEAPWTRETIEAINRDYDGLAKAFPELADLDEVARLLGLFAWLKEARAGGLKVPDLDELLNAELPAAPTPRTFPHLLCRAKMPSAGSSDLLEVLDRSAVGAALERLLPVSGRPFAGPRRLERALAVLDRRVAEQDQLAREIDANRPVPSDEGANQAAAYRAERLVMHQRVLAASDLAGKGTGGRVLSVGIGGIDLGLRKALHREGSGARSLRGFGGPSPRGEGRAPNSPVVGADTKGVRALEGGPPSTESLADHLRAGGFPEWTLPDHGLDVPIRRPQGHSWIERGGPSPDGRGLGWTRTVAGADGPESSSRALMLELDGRPPLFERLEKGRLFRYRYVRQGRTLTAVADGVGMAVRDPRLASDPRLSRSPSRAISPVSAVPAGLATLEILPLAAATGSAGERSAIRLRYRDASGKDREADAPRRLLQRLVIGRDGDLTPERALAGFDPPSDLLGSGRRLMVLSDTTHFRAPWELATEAVPGEEDPRRIAEGLQGWWDGAGGRRTRKATAVVGVDREVALARWERAPAVSRRIFLLLPDEAFPEKLASVRAALEARWPRKDFGSELPKGRVPALVLVVSGEAPGRLGSRLRDLARDPLLEGKILAVYSLSGPLRPDLPASLLAEGNLCAVGAAGSIGIGLPRILDELAQMAEVAAASDGKTLRPEDLPGPVVWFY